MNDHLSKKLAQKRQKSPANPVLESDMDDDESDIQFLGEIPAVEIAHPSPTSGHYAAGDGNDTHMHHDNDQRMHLQGYPQSHVGMMTSQQHVQQAAPHQLHMHDQVQYNDHHQLGSKRKATDNLGQVYHEHVQQQFDQTDDDLVSQGSDQMDVLIKPEPPQSTMIALAAMWGDVSVDIAKVLDDHYAFCSQVWIGLSNISPDSVNLSNLYLAQSL